ncbi:hypothetical protein YDYSY3_38670 [Paenibacillus chitinolyticus]|uniref:ATP-dependent DNA ligase n=1 Tax=Paenibacillus chitinolyticus TaxID=79263 RepID=UPI0026E5034F|nr:hypothetical protein [Paenibacillus chitinolyticus]GKS12867.1 hypothetical protein YDYSY3_38670 [Paenibacillus chitinolyticus]
MIIDPMLLDETEAPFESENHIAELKIDGIRALINRQQKIQLYSRHRNEITSRFNEIAEAANDATAPGTWLDGELAVCDPETGKPDFEATHRRFNSTKNKVHTPGLCFVAFDVLEYRGKDTKTLPLMERKEILAEAIAENELIKRIRFVENGFIPLFEKCCEQQLEGIVLSIYIKVYIKKYVHNSQLYQ